MSTPDKYDELCHKVAETAGRCNVPHDNDFTPDETLDRIVDFYQDNVKRIERLEGALAENLNSMGGFVKLIESVMGREGKELWSRPDPIGLIAEIYAGLATPMQSARAALEAK